MASFDWKKNIEDFIKDGLVKTATTTGIFYVLKVANVKPPEASLDAMDIMRLAGGIVDGVLVRTMESTKIGSTSDATKNFMTLLRAINVTQCSRLVTKASHLVLQRPQASNSCLWCLTFQLLRYR